MNVKEHKKPSTLIRVRPATRDRIDRIAKARRWSIVVAVDAAVDAFVRETKSKNHRES